MKLQVSYTHDLQSVAMDINKARVWPASETILVTLMWSPQLPKNLSFLIAIIH